MSTQSDQDPKVSALCLQFGCYPEQVTENSDGTFDVENEPGSYKVLTNSEADEESEELLESYLDDCVLVGLPTPLANYFDREAWKRDTLLSHGRAHIIATYDGNEYGQRVDGEWLFIYRQD